ncbi:MAG: uroporphyrinogen-III synthase [Actinomycetota bacterium]
MTGRQVVVCRRPDDAEALTDRLQRAGAHVRCLPVQAPGPATDGGAALRHAVARLDRYRWLAVTSAAAVDPLITAGLPVRRPVGGVASSTLTPSPSAVPEDGLLVGAVGPATAAALDRAGWRTDVLPPQATAADLARAVIEHDRALGRSPGAVLAPLAAGAGPDLTAGLGAAGYDVERIEAYAMAAVIPDVADVDHARRADAVVVAAPSVARRLAELGVLNGGARIVAIGPRTTSAILALGARPPVEAAATDPEAVTNAVVAATTGTPLV